jgi:hypothetical protein
MFPFERNTRLSWGNKIVDSTSPTSWIPVKKVDQKISNNRVVEPLKEIYTEQTTDNSIKDLIACIVIGVVIFVLGFTLFYKAIPEEAQKQLKTDISISLDKNCLTNQN